MIEISRAPKSQLATGVYSYTYDESGNLETVEDALDYTTTYAYNVAHQLIQVNYPPTGETGGGYAHVVITYLYPGGPPISEALYTEANIPVREADFSYDSEGNLVGVSGSAEQASYSYDAHGRVTSVSDANGNATQYTYDVADNLVGVFYPGYRLYSSGSDCELYTYDSDHNLTSKTMGGVTTTYTRRNSANRADGYDSLVASISPSNVGYSYDAFGRVAQMTDNSGSTAYAYADDLDNVGSVTRSLSSNADDQLTSGAFTFDGAGNPTTYNGSSLSFDSENRPTSISTALGTVGAQYDGNGLRAWKTATSATTYDTYDFLHKTWSPVTSQNPATTYFLYDGDEPVVEEDSAGNVVAINGYAGDGLRTRYLPNEPNPITSSTGNVWSYQYDPEGNLGARLLNGQPCDLPLYDSYGSLRSDTAYELTDYDQVDPGSYVSVPPHDPVGFGGQYGYYTDTETGLVLCTHRYYDPGAGRAARGGDAGEAPCLPLRGGTWVVGRMNRCE